MSRAFVKESDIEHAGIDIPERPISSEINYVTPNGLDELNKILTGLESERKNLIKDDPLNIQKKMRLERDLRYFSNRIKSAILIDPSTQPKDIILFSAKVDVLNESGENHHFEIVGEDEANIKTNKISYISPLAKALISHKLNDEVIWYKPSGDEILIIKNIIYL